MPARGTFYGSVAGLTVSALGSPGGSGRVRVTLVGDVDTAASPLLTETVSWLAANVRASVLIDLAKVTFAGSALVNFVVQLSQAIPADSELILWRSPPGAGLVLRAAGTASIATLRDLAAVPAGRPTIPILSASLDKPAGMEDDATSRGRPDRRRRPLGRPAADQA